MNHNSAGTVVPFLTSCCRKKWKLIQGFGSSCFRISAPRLWKSVRLSMGYARVREMDALLAEYFWPHSRWKSWIMRPNIGEVACFSTKTSWRNLDMRMIKLSISCCRYLYARNISNLCSIGIFLQRLLFTWITVRYKRAWDFGTLINESLTDSKADRLMPLMSGTTDDDIN